MVQNGRNGTLYYKIVSGHSWSKLSFGFKNAPPFFQKVLGDILAGIPNVLVYLDDILIYTETIEEHFKIYPSPTEEV